jgi:hypothetical protein
MKKTVFGYTSVMILALISIITSMGQVPPGIPSDNELLKIGYLDVTLLGADSTGRNISTQAIREAVRLARNYELVCYFPSGTYLVDDTIRVMKHSYLRNGVWATSREAVQIVGCPVRRPLIKLAPGAKNYQDPENPMPVFWIYAMSAWGQQADCEGSTDPLCGQSNVNFNQSVKGINFDLGKNPGAIAIRLPGAQGATIEDINIDARGAFAGLYNPTGQAGGNYNIYIEGGKYAVYQTRVKGRYQSRYTIFAGCTFKNQEIAVISFDLRHPMLFVGFHIIKEKGPINRSMPLDGLTMIDGIIELGSGKLIETTGKSVYIENVYIKGANEVAYGWKIKDLKNWTLINEYAYCSPENSKNLINGQLNTMQTLEKTEGQEIDPDRLFQKFFNRHCWNKDSFPHFLDPEVVNVKDPFKMNGNPGKGDGVTDDSDALEFAIANYDKVFLPKGNYIISRTLRLKEKTQLFGISRTISTIRTSENWDSTYGNAMIETVNDKNAKTSLSFLNIRSSKEHPLLWKAGEKSLVRCINTRNIIINENGGGRWFAMSNVGAQLLIDGTSSYLAMYETNPERAAHPQYEIRNSENIKMFYVKTESGTDGHPVMTTLRIEDSSNIDVYNSTGNVQLNGSDGMGMLEVINSNDIKIVHVNPFHQGTNWYIIKETYNDSINTLGPEYKLAIFKRD